MPSGSFETVNGKRGHHAGIGALFVVGCQALRPGAFAKLITASIQG
jgi:hypothetical protein